MGNRVCRFGLLAAAALAIVGCGGSGSSGNASDGNGSNQTPAATASFSVSAPAEIAVTPNSLQTVSISVVPAGGFSNAVSVTLSGLPAGVTATPSTFTVTPGAMAQTVAIQANAGVTPGPVNLVVTGIAGSLSQSTTTSTSQPDFALSGPGQPIALTAGGTAQVSVSAASFNGFNGQVTATLTGLPAGVTASPSTFTIAPVAAETVTLTADASAQPGSSTLMLAGTSEALSNNLELPLALGAAAIVPAVPDFSLALTPSAITLAAGGSQGQVTLSAAAINGFTGPIDVSLSGLPSGVVAMPANLLLTPGTPQQISLTVAATDTAAAATLVFNASSGTLAHTAELAVTITPPQPNFSLQVTPATLTLNAGGGAQSVSVAATALYGFSGNVNVTLSGLPAAVTASPSNLTLTPGVAQTVSLTAGSNAAAGTAMLNLLGTSGTISNSASVGLTIDTSTPDFVFSATPSTITVTPGTFQPVVVSIVPLSGFNSGVMVTTGSLPDGVVVSPQAGVSATAVFPVPEPLLPLAPNVPEVLYVGLPAGESAPVTIDFQAVAGALSHSATVTANPASTSNAASDLYLNSTPGGLLLYPGEPLPQEGSAEVAVTAGPFSVNENSPTPTITLTSPLPSGMTYTLTDIPPNSLGLASPGVDVNFTVASGLVGTSGTLAFQASSGSSSGSMTREIDVPYSIVAAPELTQLLIPSTTLTLPQGSTEDLYIALASTQQSLSNEEAPQGTITITGLPFGVTSSGNSGLFPSAVAEQLTAAPTTAVGQTPVTVTTTASGMTQTSQFTLNVVSLPNFTLTATPSTFDMTAGTTQTFTLEADAINGFTGDVSVTLTAAGNLTVTPSTLTLTPGTPQQISVSAPATGTTSGAITVEATAGTLSQTLTIPINVTAAGPDFSVQVSGISLGNFATGSFPVIPENFVGSVTETVSGLPSGLIMGTGLTGEGITFGYSSGSMELVSTCTSTPNPNSIPGGCANSVYEIDYDGTVAGTYPLTLIATYSPSGEFLNSPTYAITHTYQFQLVVTPPVFAFSALPASLTIAPGASQNVTVSAASLTSGGYVDFSLSGLPSGVTATISSSSSSGGPEGTDTTVFTVSAASDASPGQSTLTITCQDEVPGDYNNGPLHGYATQTIQVPIVISP